MLWQKVMTESVGEPTKYTDISNNIRNVKQSVLLNDEERRILEEIIVEELVKIFTHKVG